MKKYLIITCLILLSLAVQAKQKGFMETINSSKKRESTLSREEMQMRKKMHIERMKERYTQKYSQLSQEELKMRKEKLEQMLKFAETDNKPRFQAELEVINSLLEKN